MVDKRASKKDNGVRKMLTLGLNLTVDARAELLLGRRRGCRCLLLLSRCR